jgi:hypothetical protein
MALVVEMPLPGSIFLSLEILKSGNPFLFTLSKSFSLFANKQMMSIGGSLLSSQTQA